MARSAKTGRKAATLPVYLGIFAVFLVVVVLLAAYSVELGIAKPGTNARRMAVAVAEIDATLEGDADYAEFSAALRTALATHRALAVRNPADNRVDHAVTGALDCYSALRQAWQIELEGVWDPAVHGDPAYWRSFHASVQLPSSGPLDPEQVREALRAEAAVYSAEAMELVER
jgi:hypothetical protein